MDRGRHRETLVVQASRPFQAMGSQATPSQLMVSQATASQAMASQPVRHLSEWRPRTMAFCLRLEVSQSLAPRRTPLLPMPRLPLTVRCRATPSRRPRQALRPQDSQPSW